MKQFELIVFDWDGTLMDSEGRIVTCMQRAAADVSLPVPSPEAARDIIGLGLNEALAKLFPEAEATDVQRLVEAYRAHWLGGDVAPAVMFDGARELVEGLNRAGFLLAVATGKSRRGLDRALAESGFDGWFHSTRCADETFSKPHPQMLEEILTDLDTPPDRAVVIGDTEYDMQMASNAGVSGVGMTHGVHPRERLESHGAMHCFDDLFELSAWLHG